MIDFIPSHNVASLTRPPAVFVLPPGIALAFSGGKIGEDCVIGDDDVEGVKVS